MADLGSILDEGSDGGLGGPLLATVIRGFENDCQPYYAGGRDDAVGNPAPSLRHDAMGVQSFWVPLVSGDNSISVDVQQAANASPRPTMVVKANPDIGIDTDQTGTAGSGTGFVTITMRLTTTGEGAVKVELRNNLDRQLATCPCYWDNLNTDP